MDKISNDEYTKARKKMKKRIENLKEDVSKIYDLVEQGKVSKLYIDEIVSNLWEFYAEFQILALKCLKLQKDLLKIKRRCKK